MQRKETIIIDHSVEKGNWTVNMTKPHWQQLNDFPIDYIIVYECSDSLFIVA